MIFFIFTVSASQTSFNKHIMKVLCKQSVKSSHKMSSIFLSQFANSMMYSIYKKFLPHRHKFYIKMLPKKWKLEVSIKFRTNSNLPAFLCVYHQMRILQTLVQIKAPLKAYPAAKPVSAQVVFKIWQKYFTWLLIFA